jgi:hypothetical protein
VTHSSRPSMAPQGVSLYSPYLVAFRTCPREGPSAARRSSTRRVTADMPARPGARARRETVNGTRRRRSRQSRSPLPRSGGAQA